jgi:uncharacterized protein (UPF0548 family)
MKRAFIQFPEPSVAKQFLMEQQVMPLNYSHRLCTQSEQAIPGFDQDMHQAQIGAGAADWEQAKNAIRQWKMFPEAWTQIWPGNTPIETGQSVIMFARFGGLWWRNTCQIVYTIDEPDSFGFAYGTLPGHVEAGEELFRVFQKPDGSVWYEIRAFSQPRFWMARLAYPIMRYLQARFRRDSANQMKHYVAQQNTDPA